MIANLIKSLKVGDPFRDLLEFGLNTGAKPHEISRLKPRHVNIKGDYIFDRRKIFLNAEAKKIVLRLMKKNHKTLFTNAKGTAWNKHTICNRMQRISKKIGQKVIFSDLRLEFARKMRKDGYDSFSIAVMLGQKDALRMMAD